MPRIAFALLCLMGALMAQTDTGLVTGFVMDPSGSVVVGATVMLTNPQTGAIYRAQAGSSGSYAISAVLRGIYDLTAEAPGFSKSHQTGLEVNVGARVQADLTLKVGETAETIEVTAAPPILDSQTAALGHVVDNKTTVTLPLNGRNYSQLALLMPGAVPNYGSRASDGFSLNGQRTFQNVFLVDGVDNNNYILGADTGSTQAIRPSVDAIQEFKVDSASYSAEFGRAAGGVISVSIKSGTNKIRGSAFEFLRNNELDANNFFSNRAGLKRPPLRRNQFGGTVGGPVIKNRTFYFGSYQGTLVRQSTTITGTVPSGNMVAGDFGAVNIFDPQQAVSGLLRTQFPGNVIPASRLDPVGAKVAALYARPNLAGAVNNYASNVGTVDNDHQGDGRIDHKLSEKDSLFGRFSVNQRTVDRGALFAAPGNGGTSFNDQPLNQTFKAWSGMGNWTRIVTPMMVNEFRIGYTHNESNQLSPAAQSFYESFGIKGVPAIDGLVGLPTFNVAGFALLGDRTSTPNPKKADVFQLIDNVSWTKGSHSLKFGLDTRLTKNFAGAGNAARGNITFNGQFTSRTPGGGTGSALADLLLGQTSNAALSTILVGDLRNSYYGFFVSDSWKLSRKLTIELGLRYELQTPYWENRNLQGSFDLNAASATFGTVVPAKSGSWRERSFNNLDTNNWAPRLGFAYQLTSKTVLRAAGGVFYGGPGYQGIGVMGPANPPFFMNVTLPTANTAAVSQMVLSNGFPTGLLSPRNLANPAAVALIPNTPGTQVYQWNLGVQKELAGNFAATLSYVGSSSNYLQALLDANDPIPGPGAINPRRPFPQYGAIWVNSNFAQSNYHSLNAKLERRFVRGFSLLSSYTYAHGIDNSLGGEDSGAGSFFPQNPRNLRVERSSSATDIRQRLVTSGIWELPFGHKDSALGRSAAGRAIFGGWQMTGILTLQTGMPVTPVLSNNPANVSGTGPLRPNRLADGNLPADQRSIQRWFDPSAFAVPMAFTFGDSGRHIIRAPGLKTLDASLNRNFRLGEVQRLEFRAEMYNLTNTAQFGRPILQVNLPIAGTIASTLIPNRQMQLGLRLVF